MRMLLFLFFSVALLLGTPMEVWGNQEEEAVGQMEEALTQEMDFVRIQEMVDEMLGEESFSFTDTLKALLTGEEVITKEAVQELLRGLFFSRAVREKEMFLRILVLVLFAAVFSSLTSAFAGGQVGEMGFYVVYLLLFAMVMESFSALSTELSENLNWMTEFMKGLAPSYFIAVAASQGGATAAVFYQGVLFLVWMIQWCLLYLVLPCINLYLLLCLVNHISKEEILGKLSELLHTAVTWSLRSLLGVVLGLQVVRALVAPVMDALKRTALGKTASAIPGVGNAMNLVTELVVTSAVLVRNSLGVAFVLVFFLVGAGPVLHYGMMSLGYRFLAAVAQPVSDKRMVGCLSTMGEGCALLLRVFFTAELLCILTFVILMVSFGGGG